MTLDLDLIRQRENARRALDRLAGERSAESWERWKAAHGQGGGTSHRDWVRGGMKGDSPMTQAIKSSAHSGGMLKAGAERADRFARQGNHATAASNYRSTAQTLQAVLSPRNAHALPDNAATHKHAMRLAQMHAETAASYHEAKDAEEDGDRAFRPLTDAWAQVVGDGAGTRSWATWDAEHPYDENAPGHSKLGHLPVRKLAQAGGGGHVVATNHGDGKGWQVAKAGLSHAEAEHEVANAKEGVATAHIDPKGHFVSARTPHHAGGVLPLGAASVTGASTKPRSAWKNTPVTKIKAGDRFITRGYEVTALEHGKDGIKNERLRYKTDEGGEGAIYANERTSVAKIIEQNAAEK